MIDPLWGMKLTELSYTISEDFFSTEKMKEKRNRLREGNVVPSGETSTGRIHFHSDVRNKGRGDRGDPPGKGTHFFSSNSASTTSSSARPDRVPPAALSAFCLEEACWYMISAR